MPLRLTSATFRRQEGDAPKKHTCDGDNVSPPFAWSGVREGTRSFLLICDDPDARRNTPACGRRRRTTTATDNLPAPFWGMCERRIRTIWTSCAEG